MICAFIASVATRFGVVPACRALSAHGVAISPRTYHARRSRLEADLELALVMNAEDLQPRPSRLC